MLYRRPLMGTNTPIEPVPLQILLWTSQLLDQRGRSLVHGGQVRQRIVYWRDLRGSDIAWARFTGATLDSRHIVASVNETSLVAYTEMLAAGKGVLNPLLWVVMVDGLIAERNHYGIHAQGYAAYVCYVEISHFSDTVLNIVRASWR